MRLGVDLGGTKIEIVALADDGSERLRRRMPTPAGYEAIVTAVAQLVREAEAALGVTGSVGIGTPGTWSRVDGRFRNSNTVCLNGRPLRHDLQQALGRDVRLANDANCFALSEARDGAAAGAEVVFGVILGTGVGGGVVVHGKALDGPNGIAGEWGHNPLPLPTGADCRCRRATAAAPAVSRPTCRGPAWRPITDATAASRSMRDRSSPGRHAARPTASPRSTVIASASRVRSPA